MKKQRRKYTAEFKRDAIELAKQLGSFAEAARKLGIDDNLIYSWKKDPEVGKLHIGANSSSNSIPIISPTEELSRLRREVQELKKVNQILKAAAAFFSQDHLK